MSHFTVLVTKTNKVSTEEQLAPFDEDLEAEPYKNEDGETTTYNPNSKWDWYQIGGRWSGYFKLKPGTDGKKGEHRAKQLDPTIPDLPDDVADIAKVKDINWEGMNAAKLEKATKNWSEYEAKIAAGEKVDPYWDYGIEKDDTKEQYIKRKSSIATFAVVHNGEWYERGEMGWWGIVSNEKSTEEWETKFDSIIQSLDTEDEVTVVDCHI